MRTILACLFVLLASPLAAQAPTLAAILAEQEKVTEGLRLELVEHPLYKRYQSAVAVSRALKVRVEAEQKAAAPPKADDAKAAPPAPAANTVEPPKAK